MMSNPVVLLGISSQNSTTKFSVKSEDSLSMVHVNFTPGGTCYISCKNGECCAILINKKRVPKEISIAQGESACEHIQTMHANLEVLKELFPLYFTVEEDHDEAEDVDTPREFEDNTDNTHLKSQVSKMLLITYCHGSHILET